MFISKKALLARFEAIDRALTEAGLGPMRAKRVGKPVKHKLAVYASYPGFQVQVFHDGAVITKISSPLHRDKALEALQSAGLRVFRVRLWGDHLVVLF